MRRGLIGWPAANRVLRRLRWPRKAPGHAIQDPAEARDLAERIMGEVRHLIASGRHDDASTVLLAAVRNHPTAFPLQDHLLALWATRGEHLRRVADALAAQADDPAANYLAARLRFRQGHFAEAARHADKALGAVPRRWRGEWPMAASLRRMAVDGDAAALPSDPGEQDVLARSLSIRLTSVEDGAADLCRAFAVRPDADPVGAAFLLLHGFDGADWPSVLPHALPLDTGPGAIGLVHAHLLLLLKHREEARDAFLRLLRRCPGDLRGWQGLLPLLPDGPWPPEILAAMGDIEKHHKLPTAAAMKRLRAVTASGPADEAVRLADRLLATAPLEGARPAALAYGAAGRVADALALVGTHTWVREERPHLRPLFGDACNLFAPLDPFATETPAAMPGPAAMSENETGDEALGQPLAADAATLTAAARVLLQPRARLRKIIRGGRLDVPEMCNHGAIDWRKAEQSLRRAGAAASQLLVQAVALEPHRGEAWNLLAEVYEDAGATAAAVDAAQKAVAAGQPLARRALARNLLVQDRVEEAMAVLASELGGAADSLVAYRGVPFATWATTGATWCVDAESAAECPFMATLDGTPFSVTTTLAPASVTVAEMADVTVLGGLIPIDREGRYPAEAVDIDAMRLPLGLHLAAGRSLIGDAVMPDAEMDEPTLLLGGFPVHYGNYFHSLYQNVLRLPLLLADARLADAAVAVPDTIKPWAVELMERAGLDPAKLRRLPVGEAVRFRKAYVPTPLGPNTVASRHMIDTFRRRAWGDAPIQAQPPRDGLRLFLRRPTDTVGTRLVINEGALAEVAENHGFQCIDTSGMTIASQIDLFRQASVIMGPSGSALTNAVFAPAGAVMICLAPRESCRDFFVGLAHQAGHRFIWCLGAYAPEAMGSSSFPHLPYRVDDRALDRLLAAVLPSAPGH